MRFELCARNYDAHAAPQRKFAGHVAQFIGQPRSTAVLELGAGTGALTSRLCSIPGLAVLATDSSAAMVELGRENVPSAAWRELNAFTDTLPQAQLQVSSGLLQWAPEPLTVLRRWKSALGPDGRMIHAFPCDPCLIEWRGLVTESPIQWRDESAWLELFDRAGLRVARHQLWIEPMLFDSALDLLRAWHRSGVTGAPRLSAGRLRQAIRDYDSIHARPGGVMSTWAWMAVEAA